VSAILEGRKLIGHAAQVANWTMTRICARESTMRGGERIAIPARAIPDSFIHATLLRPAFQPGARAG
jgi:hypothetical protein